MHVIATNRYDYYSTVLPRPLVQGEVKSIAYDEARNGFRLLVATAAGHLWALNHDECKEIAAPAS